MGRSIIADQKLEEYLTQCANLGRFCYGLVIGQPSSQNKDYVVHLAKTMNDIDNIKEPEEDEAPREHTKEEQINQHSLLHHLVSATRMIPGSFFVLGLFVVDTENIFEKNGCLTALKSCLKQVNSSLKRAKYFYGNVVPQIKEEKILLYFSSVTKQPICKAYNEKLNTFSPVEWKFVKNPIDWYLFESNYEFDDVFPLTETEDIINVEDNFNTSLENLTVQIENSDIFIQNERVDENMLLETFIKNKKQKHEDIESFKASIFLNEAGPAYDSIRVQKFQGIIKFSGTISSRIWSNSKNSFKDIEGFIRNDILRSLAARVQIYCDSLTNSTLGKDILISEPPRRVFFTIPDTYGIQGSEYLFRNELPEVVVEQAKEFLDLDIQPQEVIMDCEGIPDLDDIVSIASDPALGSKKGIAKEISKHMYIIGIVTALLVLVLSISLHFIFR